jgi:hypothetical protein
VATVMGGAATATGMLGGAKHPLACKDLKSDCRPRPRWGEAALTRDSLRSNSWLNLHGFVA